MKRAPVNQAGQLFQERQGERYLFNLYTAFVTISVLMFIAIYNTSFITVVTLGGTVLGSALIGFCSTLLVFLFRRLLHNYLIRYALGIISCGSIIWATAVGLPGWLIKPDMATMLFLLILCFVVTALSEYTLNENIMKRPE